MCGRYYIESEDSTLELLAIIDEVESQKQSRPRKDGRNIPD